MEGLKALEKISDLPVYEENDNQCSDFGSCCDFKGYMCEIYEEEIETIKKELQEYEKIKRGKKMKKRKKKNWTRKK